MNEDKRNFDDTDKELIQADVCPNCKALHPFFSGPRGGESQMFICDNCHLELTNHVITVISNGIADLARRKSCYCGIPSMKGEKVIYETVEREALDRLSSTWKQPWYSKIWDKVLWHMPC